MSVPNDFAIVEQVYNNGHFDLTTKIGTGGQFLEPTAMALHAHNPRYGWLKKPNSLGGANKWNGHAVDNVAYLGEDGIVTAIDIVAAGESTSARLIWNPDYLPGTTHGRYIPSDWVAPQPYNFTLPTRRVGLGASLFWLIGGWISHREQVVRHLDEFSFVLGADYVRTFFCCTGTKPWSIIGANPRWPEFAPAVRDLQAYCRSIDLEIAWTMVGEGAGIPNGDWRALLDYANGLIEESYLDEMWNEYRLTGGNLATIQQMAAYWRQLRPSSRLALDTPHTAMAAPVGEVPDGLPQEVSEMNRGSAANCQTPQWDRTQPNPRDMGPDAYDDWVSHEPAGMGSSVASSNDWLRLSNQYIMTVVAGGSDETFHSKPGAWGGHCHPDFAAENQPPNIWDYDEWPRVAQAMRDVREGRVPNGGVTPVPPQPAPPYDEGWIKESVTPAIVACYTEAKKPLDSLYSVWIARTQFDVQPPNLLPREESLAKHVRECRDALGLP